MASVTIYAPSITALGTQAFDNNKSGRTIYVFKDCVETYKSNWSDYSSAIKPINLKVNAADDTDATKGKWCSYYNGMADVTVPAGTTVYTAKFNADKSRVNLTETGSQIIKKGEAVLLKSDASIELSSADDGGNGNYDGNELKGVDVATPQAASKTYYVMSKKTGKNFGFYKLASGTNLGANKAYLEVSTSGAPEFVGFGDEETSLTPERPTPNPSLYGGEWYDLQGQKLCGKPTKKGVYVVNGQKVVIK